MALSESVETSLKEASESLRNALAFAARGERPMVCSTIADMIHKIEALQSTDDLLDKLPRINLIASPSLFFGVLDRKT